MALLKSIDILGTLLSDQIKTAMVLVANRIFMEVMHTKLISNEINLVTCFQLTSLSLLRKFEQNFSI